MAELHRKRRSPVERRGQAAIRTRDRPRPQFPGRAAAGGATRFRLASSPRSACAGRSCCLTRMQPSEGSDSRQHGAPPFWARCPANRRFHFRHSPNTLPLRLTALILATTDATEQRETRAGGSSAPGHFQRLSADLDPSDFESLLMAAWPKSYSPSGRGRVFQSRPPFEAAPG